VVVEKEVPVEKEVVKEVVVTATPEVVAFDMAPDPTTLTLVDFGDVAMLDPHLAYEGSSYMAINNIIEGLVFYDRESASEFVPWLAEEVPTVANGGLSADGLTYTFNIRQGIKFHNGNDLTAEDVAYSWERALLQSGPNSGQWMMIESIMGYPSGDITEKVAEGEYAGDKDALIANTTPEELVAVCEEVKSRFTYDNDESTFTVTLAQPWGTLPGRHRPTVGLRHRQRVDHRAGRLGRLVRHLAEFLRAGRRGHQAGQGHQRHRSLHPGSLDAG